jgi:hypothetical protein
MIRAAVIAAAAALAGCATQGVETEDTGYLMISKGQASALARFVGGGVDYCKATQHNLQGIEFTGGLVFDGSTCRIEITGAGDGNPK